MYCWTLGSLPWSSLFLHSSWHCQCSVTWEFWRCSARSYSVATISTPTVKALVQTDEKMKAAQLSPTNLFNSKIRCLFPLLFHNLQQTSWSRIPRYHDTNQASKPQTLSLKPCFTLIISTPCNTSLKAHGTLCLTRPWIQTSKTI